MTSIRWLLPSPRRRTPRSAALISAKRSRQTLIFAGELLPILGTVGLLGLWLYQQTVFENTSSELRRISAAQTVDRAYQSNNALFNAIHAGVTDGSSRSGQIRHFQIVNYESGLQALEDVLPESSRRAISQAEDPNLSEKDFVAQQDIVQKQLEKLRDAVAHREDVLTQTMQQSTQRFFWAYVLLSIAALAGAVCKLIMKLGGHDSSDTETRNSKLRTPNSP